MEAPDSFNMACVPPARMGAQHIAYKFVGLLTGGTIADCDQLHVVVRIMCSRVAPRLPADACVARGGRSPRGPGLAIGVDHSHLDPGTQARVQAWLPWGLGAASSRSFRLWANTSIASCSACSLSCPSRSVLRW